MKITIKKEDLKTPARPDRLALSLRNGNGTHRHRAAKRGKDRRNSWEREWQ